MQKVKRPRTTLRDLSKKQKHALKRSGRNKKPQRTMNQEILTAIDFYLEHRVKEQLSKT